MAEVVGSSDRIAADACLYISKKVSVVMVLGYIDIFLSVLDNLLGEVVMETVEEVMGGNEPAA